MALEDLLGSLYAQAGMEDDFGTDPHIVIDRLARKVLTPPARTTPAAPVARAQPASDVPLPRPGPLPREGIAFGQDDQIVDANENSQPQPTISFGQDDQVVEDAIPLPRPAPAKIRRPELTQMRTYQDVMPQQVDAPQPAAQPAPSLPIPDPSVFGLPPTAPAAPAPLNSAVGATAPVPPNAVMRGFVSGLLEQNPDMTAETLEGFSHLAPNDFRDTLRSASDQVRSVKNVRPEQYKTRAGSMWDIKGIDDALTWAGETVGQGVASSIPSMVMGAGGAAIGSRIGGRVGAIGGAVGGAAAGSFALNYGEVYKALKDEKVAPERAAELAVYAGSAMALMDAWNPAAIITRFGGLTEARQEVARHIARRVAAEFAKGAGREGITEAAQEVVKEATVAFETGKDFATIGTLKKVVESGVGGALTGGVMGGAAGVRQDRQVQPVPTAEPVTPPAAEPAPADSPESAGASLQQWAQDALRNDREVGAEADAGPAPASEPAPVAEALIPEQAILQAYGYLSEQIRSMTPAQRQAEVQDAIDAGINPAQALAEFSNEQAAQSQPPVPGGIQSLEGNENAVQQSQFDPLRSIWGEGHQGLPGMGTAVDGLPSISRTYRPEANAETHSGPQGQRQGVSTRQRPVGDGIRAGSQSASASELAVPDIERRDVDGQAMGASPRSLQVNAPRANTDGLVGRKSTDGAGDPETDVSRQDSNDPGVGRRTATQQERDPSQVTPRMVDREDVDRAGAARARLSTNAPTFGRGDPIVGEAIAPVSNKPRKRPTRRALSLMQFIAANGGISANDPLVGDVRSIFGGKNKFLPGFGAVIRRDGKPLDRVREAAVEGGYLRDPGDLSGGLSRTTIADLLEIMDTDNRGQAVYAEADREAMAEAQAQQDYQRGQEQHEQERAEVVAMLKDAGIPPDSVLQSDIDRAAKMMADEGLSADNVWERAVMARDPDLAIEQEFTDTFGDGAFDAIQPATAFEDVEAAPQEGGERTDIQEAETAGEGELVPVGGEDRAEAGVQDGKPQDAKPPEDASTPEAAEGVGFTPSQMRRLLDDEQEQIINMWHAAKEPLPPNASEHYKSTMRAYQRELDRVGIWQATTEEEARDILFEKRGERVKATKPETIESETIGAPLPGPSDSRDVMFSAVDAKDATETEAFKRWFKNSKVVDADGKPLVVYHGARRSDRIADAGKFDPKRATSGPMAFFTDNAELASSYSTAKPDTSLEDVGYHEWFRVKLPGRRNHTNLDQAWWSLPADERARITALAPRVRLDYATGENIELGEPNHKSGIGNYDWEIKQSRGNPLKAMIEGWLNGGTLYGQEERFLDVLKAAGMTTKVDMFDPNAEHSGVLPVYLSIQNPLDTSNVPPAVAKALDLASRRTRVRAQETLGDIWHKRNRDPRGWMEELHKAIADGTNSHVWTSIPDWVTTTLRREGYDGIRDRSGKGGGEERSVWIPFDATQVKSKFNRGTFDPSNPKILFKDAPQGWDSIEAGPAPSMTDAEIARVKEIVRKVAGVDPKLADSIQMPAGSIGAKSWGRPEGGLAQGAYDSVADTITVALDYGSPRAAYHEAFHRLQNRFLTPREKELLVRDSGKLRDMLRKDIANHDPGRMAQSEIEAEAFAIYATNQDNKRQTKGLDAVLQRAWRRMWNVVGRLRNVLHGLGYQTVDDIFEKARSGEIAKRGAQGTRADTRQQAFRRWFGDSKVVDRNGNPLVVYHGTTKLISAFDKNKRGTATGAPSAEAGFFFTDRRKTAAYYAQMNAGSVPNREVRDKIRAQYRRLADQYRALGNDKSAAAWDKAAADYDYDPNVMSIYLSIRNPLVHDFRGKVYRDETYRNLIDRARAEGRDGVILKNTYDAGEYNKFDAIMGGRLRPETIYIAFEPTQVKSKFNRGTFDPSDPKILKQSGDAMQAVQSEMDRIAKSLTPEAQKRRRQIEAALTAEARRMAGPGVMVLFQNDDVLRGAHAEGPARGYPSEIAADSPRGLYVPALRVIEIALGGPDPKGSLRHEAYHDLETRLFNDREMRMLEANTDRLRPILTSHFGLPDKQAKDFAGFEVRAYAFQAFTSALEGRGPVPAPIRSGVRTLFQRLARFVARARNWLRRQGFNTLEDVFERAARGEYASRPNRGERDLTAMKATRDDIGPDNKPHLASRGKARENSVVSEPADIESFDDIRSLLEKHGTVFIRWSQSLRHDMAEGARSRDYQSGKDHAGLSAMGIDRDASDNQIFRFLRDYGYLRSAGNEKAVPRLYVGEAVGRDSDGADSIIPREYLGKLSDDFVRFLDDDNNLQRMNLAADLKRGKEALALYEKEPPKYIPIWTPELVADMEKRLSALGGPPVLPGETAKNTTGGPGKTGASAVSEVGADNKPQLVIPGAEKISDKERAERQAAQPKRATKAQKDTDGLPLFNDESKQGTLFSAVDAKTPARADGLPLHPSISIPDEVIADQLEGANWKKLSRISRALQIGKSNPTETRVKLQDKFLRWNVINKQIEKATGKPLPERYNTYLAESLYHGRAGQKLEALDTEHIDPLIKDIRKRKLSLEQVDQFLVARHAPERNAYIRSINPDNDAGSGMTDAEAKAIIEKVDASGKRADYDAVEQQVRTLIDETLTALNKGGLISTEQIQQWKRQYKYYVPLRGWAEGHESQEAGGFSTTGRGFDVRGPESKRALGRSSVADSPLGYAMMAAQQAIVRVEKDRVVRTAARQIQNNPDDSLWTVDKGELQRVIDPKTGLVVYIEDPRYAGKENTVGFKIGGEQHYIVFHGEYGNHLARALKNLGTSNLPSAFRFIADLTRIMARLATSWNPDFMIPNFIRDIGEAFINLQAQEQKKFVRSFAKHLIPAIGGSFNALMGKDGGKYAEAFREYDAAGGRIRFFGLENVDDIKANMRSKMRMLEGGLKNNAMAAGKKVLDGIEIANGSIENATRLAAYMAARDVGMTPQQAASLARELTVNFNRKGEWGAVISGFYMFANAAIQGITRMMTAMKHKRVRKFAYGLATTGAAFAIYNIAAGGEDDDGTPYYLKLAPWERDANLIMLWPKGLGRDGKSIFAIPMPYGYSFWHVIGARTASLFFGKEDKGKATAAIAKSVLDAFDPLGKDENMIAQFLPTLAKPIAHVAMNENWTGRPINPNKLPDTNPLNQHRPDSNSYFRSASPLSIGAAKRINEATGGTPREPGMVDVHPGTIDYMIGVVGGGLGRFVNNSVATAWRGYEGQEWLPEKTPVVRRFYAEVSPSADRSAYYEARQEVFAANARHRGYNKDIDKAEPGTPEARQIESNRDRFARRYASELAAREAFFSRRKNGPGSEMNLSAIREEADLIRNDRALSAVERDRKLKEIEQREISEMKRARRVLMDGRQRMGAPSAP